MAMSAHSKPAIVPVTCIALSRAMSDVLQDLISYRLKTILLYPDV